MIIKDGNDVVYNANRIKFDNSFNVIDGGNKSVTIGKAVGGGGVTRTVYRYNIVDYIGDDSDWDYYYIPGRPLYTDESLITEYNPGIGYTRTPLLIKSIDGDVAVTSYYNYYCRIEDIAHMKYAYNNSISLNNYLSITHGYVCKIDDYVRLYLEPTETRSSIGFTMRNVDHTYMFEKSYEPNLAIASLIYRISSGYYNLNSALNCTFGGVDVTTIHQYPSETDKWEKGFCSGGYHSIPYAAVTLTNQYYNGLAYCDIKECYFEFIEVESEITLEDDSQNDE